MSLGFKHCNTATVRATTKRSYSLGENRRCGNPKQCAGIPQKFKKAGGV